MQPLSRRSFVAGSAATLLTSQVLRAQDSAGPIETAVATICCDGFGDENFNYAFDAIPQLGVPNVEFNCWYARNLTPSGLDSIRKRCATKGLKPISIQASSFRGGKNHDVAREVSRLFWLMDGCDRLGCKIIKCTGARRGTAGGLDSLVEILNAVAPEAERRKIKLVLENHHRNVLEFPDDYEFIFKRVPSPSVGICFDMGHFARSGVEMEPLIDKMHAKILHIDVKDADAVDGSKFVRFGTGIVDCQGVIERCVSHGYTGYLVLELSLIDRATMLADLRQGLAITRPFERL